MGLLDVFLKGTGDPERDAAINNGLLNAGLALMQARGRLFPALGQAGQAGVQAMQQTRQQQEARKRAGLQDQLLRNQLAGQQREQDLAALPGQFYRAPSQPGVDATGGMETAAEAPNNASSPEAKFDMQGYIQALMAKSPMQGLQLKAATEKPKDRIVVGKDQRVYEGGKEVISALPDTPKPSTDYQDWLLERAAGRTTADYTTWLRGNKKSGASSTSIKIDNKLGEGVAKEVGPLVKESYDAARGAQSSIATADNLTKAIDSGKVLTGPGATFRLKGAQLGQMLGIGGADSKEVIANTRQAIQGLAQSTISARGQLKGQGTVTDYEGRLLEKAASGNIDDMTGEEIKLIASVNKRLGEQQIKNHSQLTDRMKKHQSVAPMVDLFELPTQDATAGSVNWGDLK